MLVCYGIDVDVVSTDIYANISDEADLANTSRSLFGAARDVEHSLELWNQKNMASSGLFPFTSSKQFLRHGQDSRCRP
jgi:hypothetical protein